MKRLFLGLAIFQIGFITGCAKPDAVATFRSPVDGLFYTVETYYGHGPASDTSRVCAHLERDGKAKRMLILEGENLTVTKITWSGQSEATLCLDGGITETFRSEVTLILGNASETVHNHLQENCKATSTISSSGLLDDYNLKTNLRQLSGMLRLLSNRRYLTHIAIMIHRDICTRAGLADLLRLTLDA